MRTACELNPPQLVRHLNILSGLINKIQCSMHLLLFYKLFCLELRNICIEYCEISFVEQV